MKTARVIGAFRTVVQGLATRGIRGRHLDLLDRSLSLLLPDRADLVAGDGRLRAEFVLPVVTQALGIHGMKAATTEAVVGELTAQGAIEPPAPHTLRSHFRHNVRVLTAILTQDATYRAKLGALLEAVHGLYDLETTEVDRQRALIHCVTKALGYGGIRGYRVDIENGTWHEFLTHGEMAGTAQHPGMVMLPSVSRFADKPGKPGRKEDKYFLLKLLKGEIDSTAIGRDEGNGLYRWHQNGRWAVFHIPDRKKCYFISPQRVAADERRYGKDKTAEVMFLVLGTTPQAKTVEVYQITSWTKQEPLFTDWDEDINLLGALAKALALAEENERLHARVRQLSVTDPLTQLWNRRYFDAKLKEGLSLTSRLGYPFSLIMIDIDHFKRFNDTYGHAFGDLVLREVSKAVMAQGRNIDTVARYGGEEIAVLLPGAQEPGKIAERIRRAVEKLRFQHETGAVGVTISLGVATAHQTSAMEMLMDLDRGVTVENVALVAQADAKLYQAKEAGRNRVVI